MRGTFVAHHLVALRLGQVGQDRHRPLADPQRHAAADVAGEGADRERPFAPIEADRIEGVAHQQEHAVAQRCTETQQCRATQRPQAAAIAGPGGQREEIDRQPVALGLGALLDQALFDQLLQQAVRGGLGLAQLLAQLADAQAGFGMAGPGP